MEGSMTNLEAMAINVLVNRIFLVKHQWEIEGGNPADETTRSAARLLIERAYKHLGAGVTVSFRVLERARANASSADCIAGSPSSISWTRTGTMSVATHYWRVHTRLADRFGQPCKVLARGAMNTILVEFEDGYRVSTSRNYVRRLP
jgi:hypothetical protein